MPETAVRSTARAIERLSDSIRFGVSVERPGLADNVDRAGYAMADVRVQIGALNRSVLQARAETQDPTPAPSDPGSGE